MKTPFIQGIAIRNYKSIDACRLRLPPLAFFVGANGSGKSNFLDALRFVSDSLKTSLDHALRDRGTIKEVRRKSGGHPNHFSIRLDFALPDGSLGHLSFRIGAKPNAGFEVQHEECRINNPSELSDHYYHVRSGEVVKASIQPLPAAVPDRLFLVAASGLPQFRPVFDALSGMEVYNLNPKEIGAMQKPDPGDLLRRDGGNLASVLQQFSAADHKHISSFLSRIVHGLAGAETKVLGSQETIEFRQTVRGQRHPWRFLASSMSDGTLRALGVLVAVFQSLRATGKSPFLVGLEEPEVALHPAAANVLLAALLEASEKTQILVTSHSPDLLDNSDIEPEAIFSVESIDGATRIGALDAAGLEALREQLFTPGELLRQNQIRADEAAFAAQVDDRQLRLFDFNGK